MNAPTHQKESDVLLSVAATARLLGRARETVSQAIRLGQLPGVEIGARTYVPREQLTRLLEGDDREPK